MRKVSSLLDAANAMTLVRLPLARWILLDPRNENRVMVLTALAGISDVLDGWMARRNRSHSKALGVWIDPICDKVFLISSLTAAWSANRPPAKVPIMIASREILQSVFFLIYFSLTEKNRFRSLRVQAAPLGKITTVFQFLAMVGMWKNRAWMVPASIVAGILGSGAAFFYLDRVFKKEGVKG